MNNTPAALAPVPAGPVRVLEIVGNAIVGGMETYVERLIERLPRERFTVTALCTYEGVYADRLRSHDVEVFVTPLHDNPQWCSLQLACALIESRHIDVMHAHLTNAHVLAGVCGRLTDTPVLATIHGRQANILDLEVHRAAGTHLGVVCKQSYFHALGIGVDPAKLTCIPNGVDTQLFHPRRHSAGASGIASRGALFPAAPATGSEHGDSVAASPGGADGGGDRPSLRKTLDIPEDVPLIGFVGRLSTEKGPEVFLRAALLVHNTFPQAHFVMVGDGPMRDQVKNICKRYSLTPFVHLAGVCDDMPPIYRELDVLVSTSHSEATPLAIMEAMASGLPIVATRVGGVPDLVAQGTTGWLAEPGDFEGIAHHIDELLGSREKREKLGVAGRARAVESLGIDESVNRTADLLTQLALANRAESRKIGPVVGDAARKVARAARLGPEARTGMRSDRSA